MAAPLFPPPAPAARFARMPPAAFPPLLGLLGLGLALRQAAALGLPAGLAELVLGAALGLWAFTALGYGAKLARRPGVVVEDLRILPGRAGLAAGVLGLMLAAAVLVPYSPALAGAALAAGLALHLGLIVLVAGVLRTGPAEARVVTPVWHLTFVGAIVGAGPALALGLPGPARAILLVTALVAAGIYAVSLRQLLTRIPPAPLRPLLAIHLAPVSLFGSVAAGLGMPLVAAICAGLATAILLALALAGRWVAEAGFSALWGAFTFPLAAYAGLCLTLGGPWLWPGVAALAAGAIAIPAIAYRIVKMWANGSLATRTNAATA